MSVNPSTLSFHPDAAKRYDQLSQEILQCVQGLKIGGASSQHTVDLHPTHTIDPAEILTSPRLTYLSDAVGDPTGVLWTSGNRQVGWIGADFQRIRDLVGPMARTTPIKDLVSDEFLLNETCEWLSDTLERKRSDLLSDRIASRCEAEIRTYEIWIPLFLTYSAADFKIGCVSFRTISKAIMDEWWSRVPAHAFDRPEVVAALNRRRSKLQAALAACVTVRAERRKAVELARASAQNAVALLRFLSPANLSSRLTSYCTLSQTIGTSTELFMKDGAIEEMQEGVNDRRDSTWHMDRSLELRPGVLDAIDGLASNTSTEFRRSLYDALILYSRQSQATEISDKLVFTLAALESILLRDNNEPIQKNLGERMAFLVGESIQERKQIVNNVEEVYRVRSKFVHHGHTPSHLESLDHFLANAWTTFLRLLGLIDQYQTKAALIGALEDRKMT